ncbi:MAG TPA: GAF domain-containing SpoIIE family protein phosphatase [Streptosporangiaceae bacterium]
MPSHASPADRLRGIEAITDTALSRLTYEELLAELLDRAKEILQADTAAVLLLSPARDHLTAVAAAGLEEEVAQGVRIPLGRGFAGRIAAERRCVILDRVDGTTVVNPILLEKKIQTMMGAPMIADGKVIGVMHVGRVTTGRVFVSQDAELLQVAADRAASAVQSIAARADRAAAGALQRSLLPSALPVLDNAGMAARFIPGHGQVGGDWYDAFTLPAGELGMVVGDVAGSGLPAAVIMGRMRSALRAYALESSDPAAALAKLDRKMQHFEPDALATVLYAILDPALGQVRISSAGHLPAVIAGPRRPAYLPTVHPDLMIGVSSTQRHTATIALEPGGVLAMYTDGLVERRNEPLDDGLARLTAVVRPGPADVVCATIMSAMIGGERTRDDIALLVLARS